MSYRAPGNLSHPGISDLDHRRRYLRLLRIITARPDPLSAERENPRWTLSPPHEKATRCWIPGGLEIQSDAEWRAAGLHCESDPQQYPAQQAGQICRNRAHPTIYARSEEKAQPG